MSTMTDSNSAISVYMLTLRTVRAMTPSPPLLRDHSCFYYSANDIR